MIAVATRSPVSPGIVDRLPWLLLRRCRPVGLALALALALASATAAQTVSDPRKVEFSPSSDHNATLSDGRAVVSQYVLEVYQIGATSPFHTVDMGKPAPQTDGLIRYDFGSSLAGWPLPGGTYESRVAAVGPYGTGRSTVSNQFYFCGYTVTPAAVNVTASAGTQTVTVTTQAGCAWTATSNQGWVTVAPASGTANGSVTLTIAANTTTSSRSATVTIGGKTVTITQAGAPCTYTLAPTSFNVTASAGTQTVTVTAQAGCAWTASSNQGWVTVAPASGTANGSVTLTIAANTTTSSRAATVTIGGQTVTITQAGVPCTYTLTPTSATFDRDGGSGSITVTTGTGCAWTVSSNVTWVSVVPTSGTGSGSVSFAAEPFNVTGTTTRSGTVTIGGRTFDIQQSSVGRSPSPPTNLRIVP